MPSLFADRRSRLDTSEESLKAELYQQIGQLHSPNSKGSRLRLAACGDLDSLIDAAARFLLRPLPGRRQCHRRAASD